MGDTIAALACSASPAHAPRAIVRLSGPAVPGILEHAFTGLGRARGAYRARFTLEPSRSLPVLVCVFRAPASYTGQESCELQFPMNPTLLGKVMDRLLAFDAPGQGVRAATPGEFTARALLNNRLSLTQAEGVAALIAASGEDELAAARELAAGSRGRAYEAWADELTTLLALVEVGIDFSDQEDVVPIAPAALLARCGRVRAEIAALLASAGGEESRSGLPVAVLVGAPSSGKSTLFNALLGRRRAVTSPTPGTTRDALRERLTLGGKTLELIDLAGLDEGAKGDIPAQAQRVAHEHIASADVLVLCDESGTFDRAGALAGRALLKVRTKADRPGAHAADAIEVCALDGRGLDALRRELARSASGTRRGGALLLPRHRAALTEAASLLGEIRALVDPAEPALGESELIAGVLRRTLDVLGELTGRVPSDEVLGRIFSAFCVGK